MAVPTAPIVAAALVGGYLVARNNPRSKAARPLGGLVLAVGGAVAERQWAKRAGPVGRALLTGVYLGSFGASHPLAKKIGPWPAVLTAAAASAVSSWAVADRRA
jgi:hypothetical protein